MDEKLSWRPEIASIPEQPGVYRFSDGEEVLYIGKAKNLQSRLGAYLSSAPRLHGRTRAMLERANGLTWVVCRNETEALALERAWIKQMNPEYNIALREAGLHPRLALTREQHPRLLVFHGESNDDLESFGPWPGIDLREVRDALALLTGVRTCNISEYRQARRRMQPCLLGEIGRCSAPCVNRVGDESYRAIVNQVRSLLRGHSGDTVDELRAKMAAASAEQEFETAALLRDRITALEAVQRTQAVVGSKRVNVDVVATADGPPVAAAAVAVVRGGVLRAVHTYASRSCDESDLAREALDAAPTHGGAARAVISAVPFSHPDAVVRRPRTRAEKHVLELAQLNANEALRTTLLHAGADLTVRSEAALQLAEELGLDRPVVVIEAVDIAHTQGTKPVASFAVLRDGKEDRVETRRYRVPDELGGNDPASIGWAVRRRFRPDPDGSTHRGLPDLLLIDGGPVQLQAACDALRECGVNVAVLGLAKRLEEIWLPGGEVVVLSRANPALHLLQRARDHAHSTANRYHGQRRSRDGIRSVLDSIPGVGPGRRQALLESYPGLAQLVDASPEQLSAVPGIGHEMGRRIHEHLQSWRRT